MRRIGVSGQTSSVVHYGPEDRPLCGNDCVIAVYTNDPNQVHGCADCLELVAEDLADRKEYLGRCLHCGKPGW